MSKRIFTVREAIEYQKTLFDGRVVYGRDALYAAIRTEMLRSIRVGKRRVFIPQASLDALLGGTSPSSERQ